MKLSSNTLMHSLSFVFLLRSFEVCAVKRASVNRTCCSQGMKKTSEEGKIGRKLSDHKLNRRSDAEWVNLKPLTEGKRC